MASVTRDSLTERLTALRRPAPDSLVAGALRSSAFRAPARESLSSRLRELNQHHPHHARLATHRPTRLRRWRIRVAVMAALLAVNGAATYFVPAYADALGHLPGVGYFLHWSGLGAADLTTIDAGTDHDGVGLHVSAGYADENRTVLILDFHGPRNGSAPAIGGFADLSLTDQFGHSYAERVAGWGLKSAPQARSGEDEPGYATFAPITGAAAVAGARLTLAAHEFDLGADANGQLMTVRGTWQVSFILERHPAVHTSWAPASIAGATYTFGHVTVTSGTFIEIAWRAAGPAVRAANLASEAAARASAPPLSTSPSSPSSCGPKCAANPLVSVPGQDPFQFIRPFQPMLLDAAGHEVAQSDGLGDAGGASEDWVIGTFDYVLKPGHYRFVLPGAAGHRFERDLTVP
jgi:hypothetical protein